MTATHLRPFARDVLIALVARGAEVRIWSAGGAEYSERIASNVGIVEWVTSFHNKDRGADGRWCLPTPTGEESQVVCVDDQPDGVPAHVRTVGVFPYLGDRPHDRAFERLLEGLS